MVGFKKSVFLKYLLLNSKLGIFDIFPKDGTVFSTASKKISQKLKAKKVSNGGPHVPPRHRVDNGHNIKPKRRCVMEQKRGKPDV